MNCAPVAREGEELVFTRNERLVKATHYCPGCHHGIAHRLIAEVVDELGWSSRTIGATSVGCSAFISDYIAYDWSESPHGRACAEATGIKRARPDRLVLTYQGDGDMAAIGLNESLQAANRGEKITAIMINNTVYGMTGGQMSPMTLIGQKTTTSPHGRDFANAGGPIKLAELMAMMSGTAFSARCALNNVKNIMAAKKAIKKAFEVQIEGRGFGFVELLSGCPTNLHMDPITANKRIEEQMIPVFPLGTYKDKEGA